MEINKILIMEISEMKVANNAAIVSKLESISFDIKMYMNMNYSLYCSYIEENIPINEISSEEIEELKDIRKRVKILAHKLKARL